MMRFPYTLYHELPAPIIPIELESQGKWVKIWAYVDSGATYSLFAYEVSISLGLKMDESRLITMVVGNGNHIPVHLLKLPVRLGKQKLEATIGFSEKLGVGFNLIGRKDFFEKFHICFSDREKVVTFD